MAQFKDPGGAETGGRGGTLQPEAVGKGRNMFNGVNGRLQLGGGA